MTESIANWIRQNPYAVDLGVKLEAADAASARFSLRHEERNTMSGNLHGGAIASLVSIATRAVVHASAPAKTPLCTASMHVGYVRAARKSLTVEARLLRRVRELAFFETRMGDEGGDLVAVASSVVSEGRTGVAGASPTAVRDALRPESLSPNANAEALHEAMAAIPFLSRRQLRIEEVAGGMIGVVVLSLDDRFTVIGRYGRYHRLDRASTRTSAQGGPYRARGDPGAGWAIVF